jgi:hypothetical protein
MTARNLDSTGDDDDEKDLPPGARPAPLVAPGLRAQRAPARVPVAVVIADSAMSVPYRVVRRADADPRDVIVLSSDADSTALPDAVGELLVLRGVQGDTLPSGRGTMRVRVPSAPGRHWRPLPWAARVVRDVRAATPAVVEGIGTLRTVRIWLPPRRRADASPAGGG